MAGDTLFYKIHSLGLFISTLYHTINAGARISEVPVIFGAKVEGVFQGNIDIVEFKKTIDLEKAIQISHVYIECCNNALGGKPVSFDNFKNFRNYAEVLEFQ
jgi:tryptophanase